MIYMTETDLTRRREKGRKMIKCQRKVEEFRKKNANDINGCFRRVNECPTK